MIVTTNSYRWFGAPQVWWPECPERVYPFLSVSPIVTVMQCSERVAEPLRLLAFRFKPFDTVLLDLTQPEHTLWRGIHSTTRSNINQAKKIDCQILVNEETDVAFQFINEFLSHRKYRAAMSPREWHRMLEHADVFLAKHENCTIAAQVNLVDPTNRARLLMAATVDRHNARFHRMSGHLNRLLLWQAINYYKTRGMHEYDLGGIILDRASPLYSITQFKLSFGGRVVRESTLRLARNAIVRALLRGAVGARLLWRSMAAVAP